MLRGLQQRATGDAVDTIEKHHAPLGKELRERTRRIMESGEGLAITGTGRAPEGTNAGRIKYIMADGPVSRILKKTVDSGPFIENTGLIDADEQQFCQGWQLLLLGDC